MTIGNPKHALILGLVALGAIAFFIIRLIPAPAGATAMQTGPAASQPGSQPVTPSLPTEVVRDAFSHPALTRRVIEALPPSERPRAATRELPIEKFLGPISPSFEVIKESLPDVSDANGKPSENAGVGRQQEKGTKSKIVLKAIMRAGKPLALVSINDKEDVTVGLGEFIDTNHRLTKFSQNAIQVATRSSKEWLYVGHEVTDK